MLPRVSDFTLIFLPGGMALQSILYAIASNMLSSVWYA